MKRSRILGTGRYLPERVVTNADLMKLMDTSDEWIQQRTGIKERRYAREDESTSDLGVKAAQKALEKAGLETKDIDFVIFATLSSDHFFPGSGVSVQDKLGLNTVGALDVRTQCTGFIYALTVADQFIKTEMYKHILVIGAEVHSCGLDWSTEGRDVAVIFGDGAGAVVVGPSEDDKRGIIAANLHSEGKFAKELWVESSGSAFKPYISKELIDQKKHFPKMNGRMVFKNAIPRFMETIKEACESAKINLSDIHLLIPHQANLRINEMVAGSLDLSQERVFNNIQKYGNTTAGSIPIALDEALEEGRIKNGDIVCLSAFGSGFTWGSILIRW
ncbi:MAG TPA: beta-ketoacyl-ACP synthase III [bacterium]